MNRLAMLLYGMAGPSLAGALIVVALVSGYDTMKYIAGAGIAGLLLGIPAAVLVARAIQKNTG